MSNNSNYLKGVIEIIARAILKTGSCYGYQLTDMISKSSQELLRIPLGTLYPSLYRLLEHGYIDEEKKMVGKRLRTYYHINSKGIAYYDSIRKEYTDTVAGVNNIIANMDKAGNQQQ